MNLPPVVPIAEARIRVAPWTWPMGVSRSAEIANHFAAAQRLRPALFNGRVLLSRDVAVAGERLVGHAFETDFADFLWWRDTGFPDPRLVNIFAMAALRGADGGFVLARMGDHTANAGKVYFPAGTPDSADIAEGHIDFDASVMRELEEETGLTAADVSAEAGWRVVLDGARIALMRRLTSRERAQDLRARIEAFIATSEEAELSGALVVRRLADLPANVPSFVRAYLATEFAETDAGDLR